MQALVTDNKRLTAENASLERKLAKMCANLISQ